ncbi:MAG: cyclic nucleotide-binding domain-containing protein [Verrucomicrobiales bacterium]|nr:cyclic nucleotide-binding domain-containing protein [Verrucomicrobiales bacterium]
MDERFADNLLFQGIPEEVARDLNIEIKECSARKDEILFDDGDSGEHLYMVLDGQVRISKKGRGGKQETLSIQGPGDFFGEMAILDGNERSARATAASDVVLGKIDKEGLDQFLSHSSVTARQFARLVTEQLRSANSVFIDKLIQTERLSLLGTMMTGIVHDFRNPIATLGMMGHYLTNQEDPVLIELGEIAIDSIESIKSMVQELLDFSRGETKMVLVPTTVTDLLENLDEQILRRVEGSGVTVKREIDYEGVITVDTHRFQRLVQNIIKNAWEAMKRDGTLTVRVFRDGDVVEFQIEDTGCGIPPEILAKVFEPFVTHGKSNGTGLGMAIVKSVVEAHQGTIRMESELDRGTTCFIRLPLCPPDWVAEEKGPEQSQEESAA